MMHVHGIAVCAYATKGDVLFISHSHWLQWRIQDLREGVLEYARAKFRPRPPINSKDRSSPVLARLAEARCDASHSFLSTYLRAGKFVATFLNYSR